MSSEFVPLTRGAAPAGTPDFRVRVVGTPALAPAFVAAHGNKCQSQNASSGSEPIVTLEKDGERVTAIRIECSCGQVVELSCVY
jgi:hypothetical protein